MKLTLYKIYDFEKDQDTTGKYLYLNQYCYYMYFPPFPPLPPPSNPHWNSNVALLPA